MSVERRRRSNDEAQTDDVADPARGLLTEPDRAVQQLVAHQHGPAVPSSMRSLQRMAGNVATGALVQRIAVQRDDDDAVGVTEKVGGGLDAVTPIPGQVAGAWNLPNAWAQSTDSVSGTSEAGLSTAVLNAPAAIAGVVTSSVGHHRATKDRETAKTAHGADSGEYHEANRRRNIAGGNVAQNVMKTTSSAADITGGAMAVAGHAAATVGAAVAAFVAVPLNFFSMVRDALRAEKARKRVAAVEAQIEAWSEPERKLDLANTQVTETQEAVDAAQELVDRKKLHHTQMAAIVARQPSRAADMAKAVGDLRLAENLLQQATNALTAAQARQRMAAQAKADMDAAIKTAATGKPSLHDIAAYAITKNKAGHFKKALSSVGAGLGVAGGVVLGVAAAAGGAALMATPFGWGLAAAAALIGIGLASWKAWKFFSKRWARTDPTKSKGQRLKETLMFWKSTSTPSKREQYADQLYELAKATGPEQAEAKKLLATLGINDIRGDEVKVKKLIAAKLAS